MNETFTGQNLIFVISQPRSGSTLLQRILAGHPDIQTSAETWLMLYPAYAMKNSGLDAEFNSKWANRGIQDFLENYADGNETYINAWRNWARVIYGKALEKSEKKYFLDKTPRYFFIIPELYQLFPDAKFIFLIRNPLAVLASELKTYVKGDWNILSLFYPDLIQAPNLILHGIDQLQEHAITIHYEDIVQYPEKAINQLCEKLGISFVENMLNYGDTPPPVGIMNDKVGIIRYDRPNTSSLNNWKKLTNDVQTRHFAQEYLKTLGKNTLEQLGYSYKDIKQTIGEADINLNKFRKIFPWTIAIQPKETWTIKEHYIADRYIAIKNKGIIRGTLSTIKKQLLKNLDLLIKQLKLRKYHKENNT